MIWTPNKILRIWMIKLKKDGRRMWNVWGGREMCTGVLWRNLKTLACLEHVEVDGEQY